MVGCWVTSSLSLLYQNHIVSLSLRPTIYICALFLSSFPHFLERKFLVKLIYCDPWMYIRTVVSTTIMWRHSPHFIFHLSWSPITTVDNWSDYRLVWLFQRLLSLQPSSQGASDEHTGRFPAGFALQCVHDYIYHTLTLVWIWLWCGRCARLVEDPLSLEMTVSMTASSDSLRKEWDRTFPRSLGLTVRPYLVNCSKIGFRPFNGLRFRRNTIKRATICVHSKSVTLH